jgi:hypothetical protein
VSKNNLSEHVLSLYAKSKEVMLNCLCGWSRSVETDSVAIISNWDSHVNETIGRFVDSK